MPKIRKKSITRRNYKPIGWPTKFTRRHRSIIYRAIDHRLPLKRACELAGITFATFRNWMIKGKDESEIIYSRFRSIVKSIQTKHEIEALDVIKKAQRGEIPIVETKIVRGPRGKEITRIRKKVPQYQAAIWFLERVARGTYGRNAILDEMPIKQSQHVQVSGKVKHDHKHEHNLRAEIESLKQLPKDDLEKLIAILRTVESATSTDGIAKSNGGGNGDGRVIPEIIH